MLIAIAVIAIMIRLPLTEGRAVNLDLLSIYADPFILYGYATSIPFFIALFKAIKLLGYIGQDKAFSIPSIKALTSIRICAFVLALLIALAGIYIRLFHHKDDDPAGFLAICMVIIFASVAVATAASVFERILQKGIELKQENDQLLSNK